MRRAISYWIYILFVLIFVSACGGNKQHSSENVLNDFDSICQRGELHVLTLYSSTSYFIYRGEEMGYEYERIKQFAEHYNLKTKVIGRRQYQAPHRNVAKRRGRYYSL